MKCWTPKIIHPTHQIMLNDNLLPDDKPAGMTDEEWEQVRQGAAAVQRTLYEKFGEDMPEVRFHVHEEGTPRSLHHLMAAMREASFESAGDDESTSEMDINLSLIDAIDPKAMDVGDSAEFVKLVMRHIVMRTQFMVQALLATARKMEKKGHVAFHMEPDLTDEVPELEGCGRDYYEAWAKQGPSERAFAVMVRLHCDELYVMTKEHDELLVDVLESSGLLDRVRQHLLSQLIAESQGPAGQSDKPGYPTSGGDGE